MTKIRIARSKDRKKIEKLISAYHSSEGVKPDPKRIASAVDEQLWANAPGFLLVAESEKRLVGVALGVYQTSAELGRVVIVNDFYVLPSHRRKGIGTDLAKKLIDVARDFHTDEINLEVINGNRVAESFWKSLGFERADRSLYRCKFG